jgi:hypothetical protein
MKKDPLENHISKNKDKYNVKNPKLKLGKEAVNLLSTRGIRHINLLNQITRARFIRENKKDNPLFDSILKEIESAMKTVDIDWRPKKVFNREKMIKEIINVFDYRDESYYIGSMTSTEAFRILNKQYTDISIADAVKDASDEILLKTHDYLESYIDHMKDYPVVSCPFCNKLTRKEDLDEGIKEVDENIEVEIDPFREEIPTIEDPELEEIMKNSFLLKFRPIYVETLISSFGMKEAKKRLLQEGAVALKLEADGKKKTSKPKEIRFEGLEMEKEVQSNLTPELKQKIENNERFLISGGQIGLLITKLVSVNKHYPNIGVKPILEELVKINKNQKVGISISNFIDDIERNKKLYE